MTLLRAVCLLALIAPASAAWSKTRSPSDQDQLQAACYDDVQRLCKDDIPDEDKIRACMTRQKSKVSAGCVAAYKATQN